MVRAIDVEDGSPNFDGLVNLPLSHLGNVVPLLTQEHDLAGALNDEELSVHQDDLAEVTIEHLLNLVVLNVVPVNFERNALAVEAVNLPFLFIVKALDGEVLPVALHLPHGRQVLELLLPYYRVIHEVPNKVAVHFAIGIEEVDEQFLVVQESTSDEWVREVRDCLAPVVDAEGRVDVE